MDNISNDWQLIHIYASPIGAGDFQIDAFVLYLTKLILSLLILIRILLVADLGIIMVKCQS